MGFLKQLLGKYLSGHQQVGGHGNKHGGGNYYNGGKHGERYGYNTPPVQNNNENPNIGIKPGKMCQSCNTTNLADAKFCQQCGKSFSFNCSQCGTVLLADAKFCPQCGKARS